MSMKITQLDSVGQPFTSECVSIDHATIQIQHNVGLPLCVSPDAMNKIIECVVDEFQDCQAKFLTWMPNKLLLKDENVDAVGFADMDMNALVVVPLNTNKNSNVQIELHCEHNWNQKKQTKTDNYKNSLELKFNHKEVKVKRKVNEKDDQAMEIPTIGSKKFTKYC